ncbi:MAG: polysaccharide pyruvyl transferase family protein [Thermoanaerobaculia bacterium]|nr:polysaccharide pyruvyl transferase family protein [Thermoanaerobaculia bacterium]
MKTLVAGWFSFEQMGATAGDLIARDVVCNWLKQAGILYDIALAPPFQGGVNWRTVDPFHYSTVIFVCGPFGNGWPVTEFLDYFSHARLVGLNLTMLDPLEQWNPFDILYERDSSARTHPDLTLLAPPPTTPVVGVILSHKQKEYKANAKHDLANAAIQRLIDSREMSIVKIDTRLDENEGELRTPGEVEALIAKMDLVITTRLHGTVLALKNGVPAIPIDPIAGGAKITKQVNTLGWPVLFQADKLEDEALRAAFAFCLTRQARVTAAACGLNASARLEQVGRQLIGQLLVQNKELAEQA